MRAFKKLDLQIKAFIIATLTLSTLVAVMILTNGLNTI